MWGLKLFMGFNGNLYFELLNYMGSSINSNISNSRISSSNSILKTILKRTYD